VAKPKEKTCKPHVQRKNMFLAMIYSNRDFTMFKTNINITGTS
jgi:hypothetical protein